MGLVHGLSVRAGDGPLISWYTALFLARPLLAKLGKEGKIEADRTWPRNCLPTSDFCLERGPPVPSDAIASAGQSPRLTLCSVESKL